jgi:predicted dienelactone hydrolase
MGTALRLVGLLALFGVVFALAPRAVDDPGRPGRHAVGYTPRTFTRALPDGQVRRLVTRVWYPAAVAPPSGGALSEPPPARGGPFPLVVFSHGYWGNPTDSSVFVGHLASHGFVVAAPDHRDCAAGCTPADVLVQADLRPADAGAVLDNLLAAGGQGDRVLAGLVDPERVGIAGHSFGGWTALTVLERDPRFRAGLATSPATGIRPSPDPARVVRPVMLMAGALDSMVPFALTRRFYADIPPSAPDRYLLAVQRAGHQFSDECFAGAVTTGCGASMRQDELRALVNRAGTAFFLRYVAGRAVADDQFGPRNGGGDVALVKAPAGASPAGVPDALPAPGAAPVAGAAAGPILLRDDPTGAAAGRLPAESPDPARFAAGYADGTYEIALNGAAEGAAVPLPGTYGDASIAVDAALVDPSPDHHLQLACRARESGAQYTLDVRPAAGDFAIQRWLFIPSLIPWTTGGQHLVLPKSSPAIRLGGATNRVELSCRGTTITARINGVTVASVSDNTLQEGRMVLAVRQSAGNAGPSARPIARFSNLVITQE